MLVDHGRYQGVLLLVDTNMYLPYIINVNYFFNEVTYLQHLEQNDKQDIGLWFLPQTNFGPDIDSQLLLHRTTAYGGVCGTFGG